MNLHFGGNTKTKAKHFLTNSLISHFISSEMAIYIALYVKGRKLGYKLFCGFFVQIWRKKKLLRIEEKFVFV